VDIERASFAQVIEGRGGQTVTITEDVGDIASRLKQIDERLVLRWNERGEYFQVIECLPDGSESLVTTRQVIGPELVEHVAKLGKRTITLAAEVEEIDRKAEREKDWRFEQEMGEIGERLAHALRKDTEAKHRIFLPRGV
jgi:hypothetical protein